MRSIIDRIKQGQLFDFPGGVHPPGQKHLSNQTSTEHIPLPDILHIFTRQHIGTEGQILVSEGDKVLKGQALTHSSNPFAVPIHASTSGTVVKIQPHVSAHPSAIPENCIHLQPDGEDKWIALEPVEDISQISGAELVERICRAGISGMGGAGFPTHIKLSPKKKVEFLIINGVECEPYITSDDRLMREQGWQIRQGIDVLCHLLEPEHVIIAIEDNKPEALEAMQVACQDKADYLVCPVPTKYPAGGEKQLIQIITGREVPHGQLPIDIGIISQNIGTCFAVADAIFNGKPLIQRVVTLTGQAIKHPKNVWALLGTPVSHLLNQANYQAQSSPRLVMGGPMMGFNLASDDVPVVKITNCILAPSEQEMPLSENERACIRCGACADACPAGLLPQQLFWHSKAQELDKAQEYNLFDCIECGACAYVCPSEIPLVHYYRTAKTDIRLQAEESKKAEQAKLRFDSRNLRLEREKQEREEKHRLAAEARKKSMANDGGDAKSKIAAALARVKSKQQEASTSETPTDNKDKVAAAIARAKAKKQQLQNAEPPASDKDDKKQQVAASIARAKAKREQQKQDIPSEDTNEAVAVVDTLKAQQPASQELTPAEDKKARIAAAVAKAKAKREQQKQQGATEETSTQTEVLDKTETVSDNQDEHPVPASSASQELTSAKDKKARIAAAVAKAKAKREQQKQQAASEETSEQTEVKTQPETESENLDQQQTSAPLASQELTPAEDKKVRIAAAVAKAKVKREQQNQAPPASEELTPTEDKKARIAAAVAKAKAKREQKKQEAAEKDKPES